MDQTDVLLNHGYFNVDSSNRKTLSDFLKNRDLLTIISNFNYYGYMPSKEAVESLHGYTRQDLISWWRQLEPVLKDKTFSDRNMDRFVVYKNFPQEVLKMNEFTYWFQQIMIYFGVNHELLAESEAPRDSMLEDHKLKVLHLANDRTLNEVFNVHLASRTRWNDSQLEEVKFLVSDLQASGDCISQINFRENGVTLASFLMDQGLNVHLKDATDVLRLAAFRSQADISLREKIKFVKFSRTDRRMFCQMLNESKNLAEDVAERKPLWKLFMRHLRPGDFNFPRVSKVYDDLYNNRLKSFASRVETGIKSQDPETLKLLMSRPGELIRRFHHLYANFGSWASVALKEVFPKLTTSQLLKLDGYLRTINNRIQLVYPPRGNWNKLQVVANSKIQIQNDDLHSLREGISAVIRERLLGFEPRGFNVDVNTDLIKLPTSDQELATYGRGTVFPIPDNMNFLRSASYWENTGRTSWFDNGWNFFDAGWASIGSCCWNHTHEMRGGAVFSGDPVNSHELKGRACQMIDLYLDKLEQRGVRYAVWNILCYSHIPFDQASGEVLATLQWGENAQKGKLYEPSRAQMTFKLQGNSLTKYIAYVDVVARKLVYLDANLRGKVHSAGSSSSMLTSQMPAMLEYLDTLPSVGDLFAHALDENGIPVLYSDADHQLKDEVAYVFKPENENNVFEQLDLSKFL